MKRSGPIARRTPVRKKRAEPRRVSVLRDRGFLNWLREQKCVVTLKHGWPKEMPEWMYWKQSIIDPAHGPPSGRSIKGPDDGAISLTRWYHEEQTRIGWPAFEAKYGIDRAAIAAKLYAAYLDTVR